MHGKSVCGKIMENGRNVIRQPEVSLIRKLLKSFEHHAKLWHSIIDKQPSLADT